MSTDTRADATYREACVAAGALLFLTAAVLFVPFDTGDRSIVEDLRRERFDPRWVVLTFFATAPSIMGAVTLLATHRGLPHLWHRIVAGVIGVPIIGLPLLGTVMDLMNHNRLSERPDYLVGIVVALLGVLTFVRSFMGSPWKRFANLLAAPMIGAVSVSFMLAKEMLHARLGLATMIVFTVVGVMAPLSFWMAIPHRSKNA